MYKVRVRAFALAMCALSLIGISGCASYQAPPGKTISTMAIAADIAFTVEELQVQMDLVEGLPKDRTKWTPAETQLYESMLLNLEKLIYYGIDVTSDIHSTLVTGAADPKVAL